MIGKIYFIKSYKNPDILYIGSTLTSIKNRYNLHYHNYKNKIHTSSLNKYFDQYGINSFYIELYKQYKITDKYHLLALEQLAINKYKSHIINKNNPFGLKKMKPKSYNLIIYNKNKDKYKCEYCNYKTYCNNYFNTHLKSKKHMNNSINLLNTKC